MSDFGDEDRVVLSKRLSIDQRIELELFLKINFTE